MIFLILGHSVPLTLFMHQRHARTYRSQGKRHGIFVWVSEVCARLCVKNAARLAGALRFEDSTFPWLSHIPQQVTRPEPPVVSLSAAYPAFHGL